ncbi:chromosome segregation and condensation protein ScpB [Alicycliphilus sp. B1]|nr:chromosome segregation and condensation protein ScpB [Alicycliphilus sp. B1]
MELLDHESVEAKRVLETALICAPQPVSVRELRTLFDDALGSDTVKALLLELQQDWALRGRGTGAGGDGVAISEPSRDA